VASRDARADAILDAALQLIAEVGYERVTMDAVATRAGASKATIYRRWQGKPELVMAALARHQADAGTAAHTGSVRKDLVRTLGAMRDSLAAQDGGLVLGLVNAIRGNAELADVVRHQLVHAKRVVIADVVRRAIANGELPASANHVLAAEISSALVFSRLLITGEPIDDRELVHLVDAVLMPVLTSRPSPERRRQQ
jgi:AcrR family transcriptional regulator